MKHTRIYRAALLALIASAAIACSNEITDTEAGNRNETGEAGKLITVTASQPIGTAPTGAPQTRMTYNEPNLQGDVVVNWAKEDKFYMTAELPKASSYTALSDAFKLFTLNGGAGSPYGTFTGELPSGTTGGSKLYAIGGKKENLTFINDGTKKGIGFDYDGYPAQTQKGNDNKGHLSDYDFIVATADYTEGTTPKFDFKHIGAMMKFTITLPEENMKLRKLSLRATSGYPFSKKMIWKTDDPQILENDYTTNEVTLELKQDYSNLQISDNVLTAYMMVAPTTELADKPVILKIEDENSLLYTAILNGAIIEAGKYYTVNAEVNLPFNGEGSESTPYEINDAEELRKMAMLVNADVLYDKCFKLTNDIDLGSDPWTPIDGFNGTFSGEKADGDNYTISNMNINGTHSAAYLGLFAYLNNGKISHVTVSGEIKATVNKWGPNPFAEIGGIVGRISGSTIENCTSQCTINVTAGDGIERICAGGIVGFIISGGTLTNCTNSGNISLKGRAITTELYTGAIIGEIGEDATVTLNGYTNTGSPSSIIEFFEFSGSGGSLTISETVGGTPTTINSGSGAYPIPDKGINLGDRDNVNW